MKLATSEAGIPIFAGGQRLSASYASADRGAGTLNLCIEDDATGDVAEGSVKLDPWLLNIYEVEQWRDGNALVVCGAQAVVTMNATTLQSDGRVAFEYEEAEALERPWFTLSNSGEMLVATERRVWCIDKRLAIRWMWSCNTTADRTWICAQPLVVGKEIVLSVQSRRRPSIVRLSLEEGVEL